MPGTHPRGRLRRGQTVSLIATLFVVGLAAIVTLMLQSADEQDREARRLAETQMGAALAAAQRSVGSTTLDYAWWDDAYHNLAVTYAADWAKENLTGATIIGPDKLVQGALVFGPANHMTYGFWLGQSVAIGWQDKIIGGLPQLLDQARRQDAAKPHAVIGLLQVDGKAGIVAAAPILPFSSGETPPPAEQRSVLVFIKVLDAANLASIGAMMGTEGLRLADVPGATPAAAGAVNAATDAVVGLIALDGSHIGDVRRPPPRPGRTIIVKLAPQIGVIIAIMAILAGLAIWLMLNIQHRSQTYLTMIDAKNQRIENNLKLWRLTVEAIDYGVCVFDAEGKLLLRNDAYQRIWQMPTQLIYEGCSMVQLVEWILGEGDYHLLPDQTRAASARPHDSIANSHWVYQKNERTIEVRRFAVPEIGGFISISRDMTQSRHHEQELVQAWEQAVLANRAKSEFLANISHELRTPLNAIIGFSEVLEREIFGPLANERYRSYVADIKASGSHLLSLINDILDLSKIEAGKYDLRVELVDCALVMETVARLIRPRAEANQLAFSVHRLMEPIKLRVDERALKQVLINLLSNAIKFTHPGGHVDLSCRAVPGGASFMVRDTGIGISPKDIETALAPFGQIDSQLSRRFEGTGLGLPIVKGICELHGGSLTIESEIERGTTVTVILLDQEATGVAAPVKRDVMLSKPV
jgi:signal transduction histidine kinase/sensor domain CHASE-containing protein